MNGKFANLRKFLCSSNGIPSTVSAALRKGPGSWTWAGTFDCFVALCAHTLTQWRLYVPQWIWEFSLHLIPRMMLPIALGVWSLMGKCFSNGLVNACLATGLPLSHFTWFVHVLLHQDVVRAVPRFEVQEIIEEGPLPQPSLKKIVLIYIYIYISHLVFWFVQSSSIA